jgi:hypothetical protein
LPCSSVSPSRGSRSSGCWPAFPRCTADSRPRASATSARLRPPATGGH